MTPEMIFDVFNHTIHLIIILVCVLILPGLVTGFIISLFQAATQINEQTISFVPKLLVTFLAVVLTGPWIIKTLMDFYQYIMDQVINVVL